MKPLFVIVLMGIAAISGGLLVRYHHEPVPVATAEPVPPPVVAPPIPPAAHVVPPTVEQPPKPSAFAKPEPKPEPKIPPSPPLIARVHIPPDPPAVTHIEHTTVATPSPPAPAPAPTPAPAPAPPQPDANHATLRAGMLISVRINQALSSNTNSPGDVFSGVLDRPLIADGFVIAERGAKVRGEVLESKSETAPQLALRLREILASDGQRVHIVTEPWKTGGVYNRYPKSTSANPYDAALTRDGAALVRPATTLTFRLEEPVELTEKKP
jgi:hypothetical protein